MLKHSLLALLLFCLVTLIHSRSPVAVSTDSMWSIYLAQSLIKDKDLILDEYKHLAKERKNYGLRKRKGQLYSYFPVGTALMASPFVWLYNRFPFLYYPLINDLKNKPQASAETLNIPLQKAIASIFVAAIVVILFFISLTFLSTALSLYVALMAAFATPLWSTASRGLWQHGPSAMLISVTLLMLLRVKRLDLLGLVALPLSFAYIVRPTNAVIYLCVLLYLTAIKPKALRTFFMCSALVFIPFVAFSYSFLDRFLPPYYMAGRLQIGWHFPEAFLANLFSPNRGLLFLSPILLPAFYQMLKSISCLKNLRAGVHLSDLQKFELLIAFCFFGHLTAISLFPEWWGGHAFGARYMSETTPYLIFFFAIWLSNLKTKYHVLSLILILTVFSFYSNYKGACAFRTFIWNVEPVNIDKDPSRVWSLYDLQFLR